MSVKETLKSLALHKHAQNGLIKVSLCDDKEGSSRLYVESYNKQIRVYTDFTDCLIPWEPVGVHVKINDDFETDDTRWGKNTELYCTVRYKNLKKAIDYIQVEEVLYIEAFEDRLVLRTQDKESECPIEKILSDEDYEAFQHLFYEGVQFYEQDELLETSKDFKLDWPKSEVKSLLTGIKKITKEKEAEKHSLNCLNIKKSSLLVAHSRLARRINIETDLEKEYQVQPDQLEILREIFKLEGNLDMKINEERNLLFLDRQFVKVYLHVPPLLKPVNEQIESLISSPTTTAFSVINPKEAKKVLKQIKTKGVNQGCFVYPEEGKVFVQAVESEEAVELEGTKLNWNFDQFMINKSLMIEALRSNQFTNVELATQYRSTTVSHILFSCEKTETVVAPIAQLKEEV